MATLVNPFPTLDRSLMTKVCFSSVPLQFTTTSNDGELLEGHVSENATSTITFYKVTGVQWHPNHCDLTVHISQSFTMPVHLFGPSGVACREGSVLGLAVRWSDPGSSIRSACPLGSLESSNACTAWNVDGKVHFPAGTLRGTLILEYVLYLMEHGAPNADEMHLAKEPGMILGVLHRDEVIIDGSGSLFPIQHVDIPNGPLWLAQCDFSNVLEDPFVDDNFHLSLNRMHEDYPQLFPTDSVGVSPLLREVIAGGLGILVETALRGTNREDILSDETIPEGTVGYAVRHLIDILGLRPCVDEPEKMAYEIRTHLHELLR